MDSNATNRPTSGGGGGVQAPRKQAGCLQSLRFVVILGFLIFAVSMCAQANRSPAEKWCDDQGPLVTKLSDDSGMSWDAVCTMLYEGR